MRIASLLACPLLATSVVAGAAADTVDGPLRADVLRVIDGDSLEIRARVWLGLDVTVQVRVRGLDAPELRARCPDERARAEEARARLAALAGPEVVLVAIEEDKFGGRVTADVENATGANLAEAMIGAGLGRRYDGGKRAGWCTTSRGSGDWR
mgnify:CR=1 FL=1